MRVHAIQHPHEDGRWLVNRARPCKKPYGQCPLDHLNIFTDDEFANHEMRLAANLLTEGKPG